MIEEDARMSTCNIHTHTRRALLVHGEWSPNTNQLLSGDRLLPSACLEPHGLDAQGDYAQITQKPLRGEEIAECVFITRGPLPSLIQGSWEKGHF